MFDISKSTYAWSLKQSALKENSFYFESLPSTSDQAKTESTQDLKKEWPMKIYIAREQTQGRGRRKNNWLNSEPGSSLLSTWTFSTNTLVSPTLTPKLGLALIRALVGTFPHLKWNLKAPNDIYLGSKKIAGLLVENILSGPQTHVLVGLGLNVFSHPKELETATHLLEHLDPSMISEKIWFTFLDRFFLEFQLLKNSLDQPLSSLDCTSLLYYLNQHPLLKEPYQSVMTDGSLVSQSNTTHWMEL